ncbi:MAG: DUF2797 domain-containing protein [Candidatus Anstonellales archaeon]
MHHLIRFYYPRANSSPMLLLKNSDGIQSFSLELNKKISIEFLEKKCIGYRGVSGFFPCPNDAINTKQCPTCRFRDISKVYTRLDTSGYEGMEEIFKNRMVSIYLASFGPLVKVGVSENVERRVYEQGADFWAEIMRMKAEEAYSMEQIIKERFGIPDAVHSRKKISVLCSDENPLPGVIEKMRSDELISPYLKESISLKRNIFTFPKNPRSSKKDISGKISGWKGQFLFFSDGGENFFADMKAKEGFLINLKE